MILNRFNWSINGIQIGTIIPDQSGPGSNSYEGVRYAAKIRSLFVKCRSVLFSEYHFLKLFLPLRRGYFPTGYFFVGICQQGSKNNKKFDFGFFV